MDFENMKKELSLQREVKTIQAMHSNLYDRDIYKQVCNDEEKVDKMILATCANTSTTNRISQTWNTHASSVLPSLSFSGDELALQTQMAKGSKAGVEFEKSHSYCADLNDFGMKVSSTVKNKISYGGERKFW